MTQVWFYHLERSTLERVLPTLLERSLARGWKAVVEAVNAERLQALDDWLWTWSDESFLAHGTVRDGDEAMQPVFLTTGPENPNAAAIRFCVDGADPAPSLQAGAPAYERIIVLFDGTDAGALQNARQQWVALKGSAHERTYWRQNDEGGWEKKA